MGDELFAITTVLMEEDLPRRGIGVTPVDMTDLAAVEAAITPATRVLFLEMLDEPAAADRRTSTRSRRSPTATGCIVVADNTFLGPALLRPLEHGADLVLHAATKYLSGHGDAVSGVVSGSKALHRPDPQADRHVRPGGEPVLELPRAARRADAAAPVGEGLGERGARWRRFLEADPRVEWVRYPGLASHPDHAVATRLLGRPVRRDGHVPAARRRRRAWPRSPTTCALCDIGVSLGDVFTLVYPQPKRGGLVRVSRGLRGHRGPARADFELGPVVRRVEAAAVGRSAPAERRGGRQRGADREVDPARHLVLGRPEPRLVAALARRPPSPGSEITSDTVRMQPARTGRPLPCSRIASRYSAAVSISADR